MKPIFYILILSLISKSCDETKHIYVGDHLVDCVSVAPQKCMLIKEKIVDDWTYFYGNIEGFEYEEGYEYLLNVKVETIKNPPADASNLKYTLVEVFEKNKTQKQTTIDNKWQIVSIQGIDSLNVNPTIEFNREEKRISGTAGCNNFFGTYVPANKHLDFSKMGMTRKMCPDMTVENAFINNLNKVNYYKIDNNQLMFYNNSDEILMTSELMEK